MGGALRHPSTTPLLLFGWCLLYWGTFLDAVFLWNLATEGARTATAAWGRLSLPNAVLSVAAALVWSFLGVSAVVGWRERRARSTG
jgi:amino acid transporter